MALRLFNTMSRRLEEFEPLTPPRVTLYTCGPTVYNFAHIGNFRTFLFEDLLRRYLEYSGYDVFHVMNLTDVDDRTIQSALDQGQSLEEHTRPFIEAFHKDVRYLRMEPAHVYPRATEYIGPMVDLVQGLLDREKAYRGDDGSVYFSVDSFDGYGRLSKLEGRELKSGTRVSSDDYDKDDVRDFALWKSVDPAAETVGAAWDAPFGRGRPGWHLECSAMARTEVRRRYGVETVDIHAGGVDLIFPHHENEIAQSEAVTGKPFARYWLHGEFLTVEGTKMAKRDGNFLTPRDLRESGVEAATVRMLFWGTHYRQRLNLADDLLESAKVIVDRLGDFRDRLVDYASPGDSAAVPARAKQFERDFTTAMDDDLNAPRAKAAVFDFMKAANRGLDLGEWSREEVGAALVVFDRALDVLQVLPTQKELDGEFAKQVEVLVGQREQARAARDFATADHIRDQLAAKGVEVEDTPAGPRWKVRSG